MADQVSCLHLLLKHTESRNPISRRTNQQISLSKQDAIAELQQIIPTLTPENFAQKAFERSDCGSYRKGGDLGVWGRGQMQAPFEEATYALKVGQMSGIVDTGELCYVFLVEGTS